MSCQQFGTGVDKNGFNAIEVCYLCIYICLVYLCASALSSTCVCICIYACTVYLYVCIYVCLYFAIQNFLTGRQYMGGNLYALIVKRKL